MDKALIFILLASTAWGQMLQAVSTSKVAVAASPPAVTLAVATPSTSNVTSYATGSFSPAVGDLLIVEVVATATVAGGTATDSTAETTFTQVARATKVATADTLYLFVANSLTTSTTSRTVTFDCTGDAATGAVVAVYRVSNMTLTGTSAIVQYAFQSDQASATPAPVFANAVNTNNPVLTFVGNATTASGVTAPSGFHTTDFSQYSTPSTGFSGSYINSGSTATTLTWGGSSATAFGAIAVELHASAGSLVQNAAVLGTSTTSTVTTKALTAGNLVVVWSAARYTGTGSPRVLKLSSVTATGETFTHCPNSEMNDAASSDGTIFAVDCFYTLSAVGGATSVVATWTATGYTSSSQYVYTNVREYHPPSTPIYYDTSNGFFNTASCSSCSGPAGLLSGSSDFVSQAVVFPLSFGFSSWGNGVGSSPYVDFLTEPSRIAAAFASATAQSSYSVPTWTNAATGSPSYHGSIAFSTNSTPTPTAAAYLNFSGTGCSNGTAPTSSCLSNSTTSGWGIQYDVTGIGAGMTDCTSVISSNLPATLSINGVSKSGTASLDLCGVTAVTGTNVKKVIIGLSPVGFGSMSFAPLTLGYSFRSSCPANVECGAFMGIFTPYGDYVVTHISPLGDGHWCLEASNGGGCQEGGTPFNYAPNTNYRINIQYGGISGGTDKMTVCNDSTGAVLGTITATSVATSTQANEIDMGFTGEEPTTAGYNYYWRNVVIGGTYSASSCF